MIASNSAQIILDSNEWLGGFISGVLATLIGFILTILWDIYKYRRDTKSRDDAVITAVNEELVANVFICESNKNALGQELKFLKEKKSLVSPISLFQNSTWDLLKINFPKQIGKDKDLLKKIRNLTQLIDHTNESIRSRENYRINNGAMSNYESRLQKYDENILEFTNHILANIETLKNKIDMFLGVPRKKLMQK